MCNKTKASNPISPRKWWSHFLNFMNRHIDHQNKDFEDSIDNFVCNIDNSKFKTLDFDITADEVVEAINHLKRGKSAGIDGIKTEMIKDGISLLVPSLVQLLNLFYIQVLSYSMETQHPHTSYFIMESSSPCSTEANNSST